MARTHKTHCGCSICSGVKHSAIDILNAGKAIQTGGRARTYATPVDAPQTEYAFEVAASNLRYGEGVTRVSFNSP